jgi:alpha-tubulin suppressor-like RCC1 family protein
MNQRLGMRNFFFIMASLAVTQMPLHAQPTIINPPTNQVLALGATLTLSVTTSDPLAAYQWFKDNRLLLGATNSTLTVTNASVTNSGTYFVVATNGSGMVISLPALVTVGSPSLLAWGYNGAGELGNGTTSRTNRPTIAASNVVAGAAGLGFSLFVTSNGILRAIGDNYYGQLGNGADYESYSLPVSVASNVVVVAAGGYHSLFVKSDGTLWAMGYNINGQLGNGTYSRTNRPVCVASNVVAAAAGGYFSLFVKSDGTLWGMGDAWFGELGSGATYQTNRPVFAASNVVATAAGMWHSLFVKTDRTLWAMGDNHYGQLGCGVSGGDEPNPIPGSVASNVTAVAAGGDLSLFVKMNGTLWTVGCNINGELGDGTTNNASTPVCVASNVVAVASGYSHSLFLKEDGTLGAMGANYNGQLGNGTTNNAYQPVSVSGFSMANIFAADIAGHSLAIGIIQPPSIHNFTANSTNHQQLALQFTGTPNYPYILQVATNLTPPIIWQSILTNPADGNGNWSWTITGLSNSPAGFYRAVGQ